MGAGAAEDPAPRGCRRASRHEEGLGDPQGQSETRRRAQRFLHELGEEAGRDSLPCTAVHEDDQGAPQRVGRRGPEALRVHDRPVREVRAAIQVRSADAGRAGLPGVDARSEQEEPCRRDRRDADHARDRKEPEGRGRQGYRVEHSRRRKVHGSPDDPVFQGREFRRAEPDAVRVRELQRRSRQHREDAQGSRETGPRPEHSGSTMSRR